MDLLNQQKRVDRKFPLTALPLISLGTMVASESAMAQVSNGTLQYGPLGGGGPAPVTPIAIPALGGTGLVLLSMFLLLAAWRMHRNGAFRGGHVMAVALISGALASGLGGVKLVGDAMAQAGFFRDMTSPSGGTLTFEPTEVACVRNATGVSLQIFSMEGVSGFVQTELDCGLAEGHESENYPGCEAGAVLTPGDVCGVLADSQSGQGPSEPSPETQASQLVGPEGGVLQVGDVILTIPAGALDSEVSIDIAISSGPLRQANGSLSLSSPLITLTPHGQVFETPVFLSFPYSLVEENTALYRLDDELDTTWELLPASLTDGQASVQLSSFSVLGVWGERPSQVVTYNFSVSASNLVRTARETGQVLPGEGESAPVDPLTISFSATFDISQLTFGTPSGVSFSGGLSLLSNDDAYHEFNPLCCPWLDLKYLDRSYTELSMPLLGGGDGGQYTVYLTIHSLLHNPQMVDFHFDQSLFAGNFVEVKTWRPRQGSLTVTGPTGSFTRSWQNGPQP